MTSRTAQSTRTCAHRLKNLPKNQPATVSGEITSPPEQWRLVTLKVPEAQDYFTNKVCSVGKSCSPRDVTQGNPLRPPAWGFKMRYFSNIYGDFSALSYFPKKTRPKFHYETLISYVSCILKGTCQPWNIRFSAFEPRSRISSFQFWC